MVLKVVSMAGVPSREGGAHSQDRHVSLRYAVSRIFPEHTRDLAYLRVPSPKGTFVGLRECRDGA